MQKQWPLGAGIVIVRRCNDSWEVLGLKLGSLYDLPKGQMDPGENTLSTAVRETREEASITDIDFIWGKQTLKLEHLTFYIAATSQDGKVKKNPKTSIQEHDSIKWMTWDEIEKVVFHYLRPAISWAKKIVEEN